MRPQIPKGQDTMTRTLALKLALAVMFALIMTILKRLEPALF
jgi:hypothetical protein